MVCGTKQREPDRCDLRTANARIAFPFPTIRTMASVVLPLLLQCFDTALEQLRLVACGAVFPTAALASASDRDAAPPAPTPARGGGKEAASDHAAASAAAASLHDETARLQRAWHIASAPLLDGDGCAPLWRASTIGSIHALVYELCTDKSSARSQAQAPGRQQRDEDHPILRARSHVDAALRRLIDALLFASTRAEDGVSALASPLSSSATAASASSPYMRLVGLLRAVRIAHACVHTIDAAFRYAEQYAVRAFAWPPLREVAYRHLISRLWQPSQSLPMQPPVTALGSALHSANVSAPSAALPSLSDDSNHAHPLSNLPPHRSVAAATAASSASSAEADRETELSAHLWRAVEAEFAMLVVANVAESNGTR
jgi:hypothetical protein